MATTKTVAIAEGQTTASSSTITIPAGAEYFFSLTTTDAKGIPPAAYIDMLMVQTSGTRLIYSLRGKGVPQGIRGPVDVKGVRPDLTYHGVNVGLEYTS